MVFLSFRPCFASRSTELPPPPLSKVYGRVQCTIKEYLYFGWLKCPHLLCFAIKSIKFYINWSTWSIILLYCLKESNKKVQYVEIALAFIDLI